MSSKLESDVCYCVAYGWRRLVKAAEVTAGLAESNGSLPPGGWLEKSAPGSLPVHRDQLWAQRSATSMGEL